MIYENKSTKKAGTENQKFSVPVFEMNDPIPLTS